MNMKLLIFLTFTCLITCQAISLGTLRKSVSHALEQVTSQACPPGALPIAPGSTACGTLSTSTTINVGSYGGGGGSPFSDQSLIRYISSSIRSVRIRAGSYVDQIQINYDGMWSQPHGGAGGVPNSFDLQAGEYIVSVFGRASWYFDSIGFKTNKGRVYGPYGGGGGAPFSVSAPSGYALAWLNGRSSTFVDQLQFVFSTTSDLSPSTAFATSQPTTAVPTIKPTTPPTAQPTTTAAPTIKPTTPPTSQPTTAAPIIKPTVPPTCAPGTIPIAPGSPTCATLSTATTINAGTYGGPGGSPFSDQSLIRYVSSSIKSVRIRAGAFVDQIQINYDGAWSQPHGGAGGAPNQFDLQAGEYIVSIFGRSGWYFDSIGFRTNKGRVFGPYGGPGGNPFSVNASSGYALAWLTGRSSAMVDQLTFVFSKTQGL